MPQQERRGDGAGSLVDEAVGPAPSVTARLGEEHAIAVCAHACLEHPLERVAGSTDGREGHLRPAGARLKVAERRDEPAGGRCVEEETPELRGRNEGLPRELFGLVQDAVRQLRVGGALTCRLPLVERAGQTPRGSMIEITRHAHLTTIAASRL